MFAKLKKNLVEDTIQEWGMDILTLLYSNIRRNIMQKGVTDLGWVFIIIGPVDIFYDTSFYV